MIRRIRRAARIVLVNGEGRMLMFRFNAPDRPPFWCAPGGEVEPGETYPQAARRELREETGIDADPGPEVAQVISDFLTLDGEPVTGDDRYFLVRVDHPTIDTSGHTASEQAVMREYRWFTREEFAHWPEKVYPIDMPAMLARVLDAAI